MKKQKDDEPDKFAECREAAWLLVDQAWAHKRRGTLSEAANGALDRILLPLHALNEIEKGEYTNPGEVYYWGVKLGVAAECLRVCLESAALKRERKAAQDRKKATAIAAEVRVSNKEDGYEAYRGHYEKIKKSHTKWSDDRIFEYISTTYGPSIKEIFGIGEGKATVRRAILGK